MAKVNFRTIHKEQIALDVEGRVACKEGKSRDQNPYVIKDKRRVSWDIGWLNASLGVPTRY